jgi:hypothetical protein
MDLISREYQTPKGFWDQPFIYVYDANALTDGASYRNIRVDVGRDRAGFVLRQIYGRDKVAARIQLWESAAPMTAAANGIAMPRTYPVAPERVFPPAGILLMDLYNVLRANRAALPVIIYYPQLAFQGVRRWAGDLQCPAPSKYKYYERPFTYTDTITVNWPGTDPIPRYFNTLVSEGCDFELQRITIIQVSQNLGQGAVLTGVVPDSEIKLMLYEPYGRELMSAPVLDVYLNDAADARTNQYNGVFPAPAVLYPDRTYIKFGVVSLLTAAMLPTVYQICFCGMRRVPC